VPWRCSRTHARACRSTTWLALALAVAALVSLRAAAPAQAAAGGYERADAQTIRDGTREIVSDPRFAPRKTFWQWLGEKLLRWDRPDVDVPEWLKEAAGWTVITWCVLTLLAILGHAAWTIWMLAGPARRRSAGALGDDADAYESASCEQLWERAQALAGTGAFRAAAGILLVALLRRLDALKVLSFHKSKTNGEYAREYPDDRAGRREFTQFIAAFERSIYGGREVPGRTYEAMSQLARRIIDSVSQNAQI
jgi:hypothetical protein